MTPFRGEVRSGNSGGPAVDGAGRRADHRVRRRAGEQPGRRARGPRLGRPQGPGRRPRPNRHRPLRDLSPIGPYRPVVDGRQIRGAGGAVVAVEPGGRVKCQSARRVHRLFAIARLHGVATLAPGADAAAAHVDHVLEPLALKERRRQAAALAPAAQSGDGAILAAARRGGRSAARRACGRSPGCAHRRTPPRLLTSRTRGPSPPRGVRPGRRNRSTRFAQPGAPRSARRSSRPPGSREREARSMPSSSAASSS